MSSCITRYIHSDLPKPGSDLGEKVARYIYEWYRYAKDARIDLEQDIWPACDDAYHCFRELPRNKAMKFVDKGDIGESDLKDLIDQLSDGIMIALMGRDDSWFQPISYKSEEQGIQNMVRDYLAYKHREAGTRKEYGLHVGQTMRRGTSAIGWEWKKDIRMVRLGPAESLAIAPQVSAMAQQQGIDLPVGDIHKALKRERKEVITFNGPVVRPLDMYDVLLDPAADIRRVEDAPMATIVYKTPEELKNAEDQDGNKFFSNLDDLHEWAPQEVYMSDPMRYRSTMTMGINPFLSGDKYSKFIPVLIYRKAVLTMEDNTWVDCFFYVALQSGKNGGVLIACQENPSDQGRRDVFIDTYRDWLNCAYGVSAIEKSIPDWQKKNVASALGLNAALIEIFPPLAVIANMLADDREIDVTPGGYNVINYKPSVLTNFCAPIPIARGGAESSMNFQRFLGQKILGQGGAYGAINDDPTKSMSTDKTATQINTETTSGTVGRDNLLEKLSGNLEKLCQAIYDGCRQYEEDDMINFIQNIDGGDPSAVQLDKQVLDQDRRIVCTGWHGLQNKQQELAETREMFQALSTGNAAQVLPNGVLIMQDVIVKYLGLLGFKNLQKYKTDPAALLIQQPQVQQELNQMMMILSQRFTQLGMKPDEANQALIMIAQTIGVQPQAPPPGGAPGQPPPGSGAPVPGQPGSGQAPPAKPPGPPPQQQAPPANSHGGHDIG